jgi:GNAT superfamily N-acetyltransferase
MPPLATRFQTLHRTPPHPADVLQLRPGSLADYRQLARHHYKAAAPATVTAVWTLADPRPTVVGRYLHRTAEPQPVGVLVESLPSLSCRARDAATRGRYIRLDPRPRALLLNRELRCISRVVVDPRFRGLGLAVRLVRHALAHATTPYTEALAAMGHVHPFFVKAGMTAYPQPPLPKDRRLLDALQAIGLPPDTLTHLQRTREFIDALPPTRRAWVLHQLHRWYRQSAGRSRTASHDPHVHLQTAQRKLLLQPLYHLAARDTTPA